MTNTPFTHSQQKLCATHIKANYLSWYSCLLFIGMDDHLSKLQSLKILKHSMWTFCPPPPLLFFHSDTLCITTTDITCPLGYVDIGLIPEGARDIRIEEVAEAGNFLALRSDNPSKYFLNGGWTIQWNGEYKAAGTVFTYERTGHLENLTSPGPTMEPLWIQVSLAA